MSKFSLNIEPKDEVTEQSEMLPIGS